MWAKQKRTEVSEKDVEIARKNAEIAQKSAKISLLKAKLSKQRRIILQQKQLSTLNCNDLFSSKKSSTLETYRHHLNKHPKSILKSRKQKSSKLGPPILSPQPAQAPPILLSSLPQQPLAGTVLASPQLSMASVGGMQPIQLHPAMVSGAQPMFQIQLQPNVSMQSLATSPGASPNVQPKGKRGKN